jgi:hypothetical protein
MFDRRKSVSRTRFLLVSEDGSFAWITSRRAVLPGKEFILSADDVSSMVEELVVRTYVVFGGKIWKQVIGIPMGTNCAGFLANLYCFTYELAFMERLVSQRQFDLARSFQRCLRYIDDLLCFDVARFEEFLYFSTEKTLGIYPKEFLSLSLADSGTRVPYMDIALRFSRRRGLYTAIYDKRLDVKYSDIKVIRYPDSVSFLSSEAKYGIVTSQMHRFSRRCTRVVDFCYNVGLVLYRMEQKGYRNTSCYSRVRTFLRRNPQLYGGGRSIARWTCLIRRQVTRLSRGEVKPGPYGPVV